MALTSVMSRRATGGKRGPVMTNLCVGQLHVKVPLRTSPAVGFTVHTFKLHHVCRGLLSISDPCGACHGAKLPPKPVHVPSVTKVSTMLGRAGRGFLCVYTGRSFSKARDFTQACARRLEGTTGCSTTLGEENVGWRRNQASLPDLRAVLVWVAV